MAVTVISLVTAGLFAAAVVACAVALAQRFTNPSFSERIRQLGMTELAEVLSEGVTPTLDELELAQPFGERVVRPAVRQVLRIAQQLLPGTSAERIALTLARAGFPRNLSIEAFLGLKLMAAIGFAVAAVLLQIILPPLIPPPSAPMTPLWTVLLGITGYFFPDLWLRDLTKRRQKAILRDLPDTIDLLSVSVTAGLAFDASVARVCQKTRHPLAQEFDRYLREMRLGKPRREALRQLSMRAGVAELDTFISAIVQADQLGVSIAELLRLQSEQMRVKRRQRAEKIAQQAPLKMLFPMILFIFPSVFVVILGPAVHQLMDLGKH